MKSEMRRFADALVEGGVLAESICSAMKKLGVEGLYDEIQETKKRVEVSVLVPSVLCSVAGCPYRNVFLAKGDVGVYSEIGCAKSGKVSKLYASLGEMCNASEKLEL